MKLLFTGGGTGGHFYPIIAVVEEIDRLVEEKRLLPPQKVYMASTPYDEALLAERNLRFKKIPTGKMRAYFSPLNVLDLVKAFVGIVKAMWEIFLIFPDVVFGKGGADSFPALVAARFFGIPVVIHETDSVPGKVNRWAGTFAKKIGIAFPEAAEFFPREKVALVGNPIRRDVRYVQKAGAREFLRLEGGVPVLFITGGSQGARALNEGVIDALQLLVEKFQVIHATGDEHIDEVKQLAAIILKDNERIGRYKPFGYLNALAYKIAAGAADVVVSRGGGTIFEIAQWGLPSVIVPLPKSKSDHQRTNAYSYARSGAAVVIEEKNLSPSILLAEIERIVGSSEVAEAMREGARAFAREDAAAKLAETILELAIEHER